MNALERFLAAGPDRRAALENSLEYYIPPELRAWLGLANELNPVTSMERAGQGSVRIADPSVQGWDKVQAIGDTASNMAGVVAPVIAGSRGAVPAVNAMEEAVMGWSSAAGVPEFMADEFGGVGFRVFHGSPHDFDKFSMDKIGTGEGAQAYGHGLYFAENEGVARDYRDALGRGLKVDGTPMQYGAGAGNAAYDAVLRAGLPQKVADDALWYINRGYSVTDLANDVAKSDPKAAETLRTVLADYDAGRMYEVQIDANPEDFLDWDKPLSEQPNVTERLRSYGARYQGEVERLTAERDALAAQAPKSNASGEDFDAFFADDGWGQGWTRLAEIDAQIAAAEGKAAQAAKQGALFSNSLNDDFLTSTMGRNLATASGDSYSLTGAADNVQLSQQLREAGIPGIRYLDAGSRGAGDGSRNYVVFDDNLIEIIRKYGWAAAAPMLAQYGVSEAEAREMYPELGGNDKNALSNFLAERGL
jgi:hypothetical protein